MEYCLHISMRGLNKKIVRNERRWNFQILKQRDIKSTKRYESLGSSLFNTTHSGQGSFNLNMEAGNDEEGEVPYLEHPSSDLMDMCSNQMPYLEHLSSDLMDMCSYQMPYLEHPSSEKFVNEHVN
ncbi:hypothetical protein Tco_1341636, partial [Tanacetum coccineum]